MSDSEARARAALDAVPGLVWRPFGRDDLPAIADFYAACEAHDCNPERRSLDGLREFWDSPRSVPADDTLVARDRSSAVVATAWAGCNRVVTDRRGVHLGGAVRPDHRRRGLGTAILRWELAHARAWDAETRQPGFGPLDAGLVAPTDQADVRRLATRHGLEVARYSFEMSRSVDDPPIVTLAGVRLADWRPERGLEVHRLLDAAFHDHWGHVDRTEQMWAEFVGSHAFRPAWSVLAVDEATDEVVGAAVNYAWEQDWTATGRTEGYTEQLGVAGTHRGRGIGSALLAASIRRFATAGLQSAALGVDTENASGALALYESLGYRRTASTCVHQLLETLVGGAGRRAARRGPGLRTSRHARWTVGPPVVEV